MARRHQGDGRLPQSGLRQHQLRSAARLQQLYALTSCVRGRVRKTIMRDVKRRLSVSDSEPPGLSRRVRTAGINPAARLVFALAALIALAVSLRAAPPAISDKTNVDPQAAAANKPDPTPDEGAEIGAAALFINGFPSGAESFCELAL